MKKFLPLLYAGIVGVAVGYSWATFGAIRDQPASEDRNGRVGVLLNVYGDWVTTVPDTNRI